MLKYHSLWNEEVFIRPRERLKEVRRSTRFRRLPLAFGTFSPETSPITHLPSLALILSTALYG